MLRAIDTAIKSFCTDIVGLEIQEAKYIGDKLYGAAIALYENEKETQWYLLFKKHSLNQISKALLFDDDSKEDDLDDLVKEIANLIIGSAKVILETNNSNAQYRIGVPDFLGHVDNPKMLQLEEILLYKIKNRTFVVGKG